MSNSWAEVLVIAMSHEPCASQQKNRNQIKNALSSYASWQLRDSRLLSGVQGLLEILSSI